MDSYAQRKLFAEILAHVRERLGTSGFTLDFVFMTGDIANSGQPAEYEEFLEAFYIPLINIMGNAWDGKFFATPGNHDADRGIAQFFAPEEILK